MIHRVRGMFNSSARYTPDGYVGKGYCFGFLDRPYAFLQFLTYLVLAVTIYTHRFI